MDCTSFFETINTILTLISLVVGYFLFMSWLGTPTSESKNNQSNTQWNTRQVNSNIGQLVHNESRNNNYGNSQSKRKSQFDPDLPLFPITMEIMDRIEAFNENAHLHYLQTRHHHGEHTLNTELPGFEPANQREGVDCIDGIIGRRQFNQQPINFSGLSDDDIPDYDEET